MSKLCAKYQCERSYNGYSLDVMKSALQKYIRICDPVKAIYAAAELDLFAFAKDENGNPNGEGIRSNFIHRLMVIFMEDVFSLGLWGEIDKLIFELLSLREQRTGGKISNIKNKKEDILSPKFCDIKRNETDRVCKTVYLLSMSTHSRENSFYKFCFSTFFSLDKDMKQRLKKKFGWFEELEAQKDQKDLKYEPVRPINQVLKGLGKEITDLSNQFVSAIERRSEFSIYFGHLLSKIEKLPVKIGGRSKPTFLIFALIRHVVQGFKENKNNYLRLLDIAERWYVELSPIKEEFLTWQTILIAIIKGMNPAENNNIKTIDDLRFLYKRNIFRQPIELDDWVFDMHTKIGKMKGKDSAHFATVSSFVCNEATDIIPQYKDAYTKWKIFQASDENDDNKEDIKEDVDDIENDIEEIEEVQNNIEAVDEIEDVEEEDDVKYEKKEKDEKEDFFAKHSDLETDYAKFIVRAQLVTGNTKTDTYFGEKNGKVIFIKGPFKESEEEMQSVMDMQEIKQIVGLPTIEYRVVMLKPNRDTIDMEKAVDDPTKKKDKKEGLGFRKTCNRSKLYPFLVSEVLFSDNKNSIPIKKHGSVTWPDDTEILDLDRVKGMKHTSFDQIRDPDMKRMYVENIMFRYITGMPDLASRNFVVKDNLVYSIDEDSIEKDFDLEKAFSKKNQFAIFVDELRRNKEYYNKILFRYIRFMPYKKIKKELELSLSATYRHLFLYNLINETNLS